MGLCSRGGFVLELGAREGDLCSRGGLCSSSRGGFVLELGAREGGLCSRGDISVLELGAREGGLCSIGGFVLKLEGYLNTISYLFHFV